MRNRIPVKMNKQKHTGGKISLGTLSSNGGFKLLFINTVTLFGPKKMEAMMQNQILRQIIEIVLRISWRKTDTIWGTLYVQYSLGALFINIFKYLTFKIQSSLIKLKYIIHIKIKKTRFKIVKFIEYIFVLLTLLLNFIRKEYNFKNTQSHENNKRAIQNTPHITIYLFQFIIIKNSFKQIKIEEIFSKNVAKSITLENSNNKKKVTRNRKI